MNKQHVQHFAKQWLDQLPEPDGVTADIIIEATAKVYGLSKKELVSRSSSGLVPEAKQTASYLIAKHTELKGFEIGYRLRIERSSAANAKRVVGDLLTVDLGYIARYVLVVNQIIKIQHENKTEQITA